MIDAVRQVGLSQGSDTFANCQVIGSCQWSDCSYQLWTLSLFFQPPPCHGGLFPAKLNMSYAYTQPPGKYKSLTDLQLTRREQTNTVGILYHDIIHNMNITNKYITLSIYKPALSYNIQNPP